MRVLITGISGVGKSAVAEELARQGYAAYNTDDLPEVTRLESLATGLPADWPAGGTDFTKFGWNWQENGLMKLLSSADTVFIAGSPSNLMRYRSLFDMVILLRIDQATLKHRLSTRTSNDFGKQPTDFAFILKIHQRVDEEQLALGAVPIDATQPLTAVVSQIVQAAIPYGDN